MSLRRLRNAYRQADKIDREEGMLAYFRYHALMAELSAKYDCPLDRVVAVFVSLSPNSTYGHNLRGAASVLKAVKEGVPCEDVVVATYKHCRDRAYSYATGAANFLDVTRGPKVLNFYHNLLTPNDARWVTIDGHMSALWQGKRMTMREALIPLKLYRRIAHDTKELAFEYFMLPQQMQAVLWFVRKRLFNIGFNSQTDIFQLGDQWNTARNADTIEPYPFRRPEHLDIATRVQDIRSAAERPGAIQRLLLPGVRPSGRGGLRLGGSMGMEPTLFAGQAEVLSAPRGDNSNRNGRPMRNNGKAHPKQANGKPVLARRHPAAHGEATADAETHRRTPRRRLNELPPRELGVAVAEGKSANDDSERKT